MAPVIRFSRNAAVVRIEQRLQRHSFPRLQMSLIVALTGGSGLLFSFLFLKAGITSMVLRYPLALLAAYGVFLLLVWLWLRIERDDALPGPSGDDVAQALAEGSGHLDLPLPSFGGGSGSSASAPGGGGFGGGGASSSFEATGDAGTTSGGWISGGSGDSGSSIDIDGVDELVIPLLVILLGLGLAFASLYIIYAAPSFFAEVLVDGTLSGVLYRRIKRDPEQNWLATAVRRTAVPFALTALLVTGVGWGLSHWAPGAHTIGQALHQA